MVDLRSLNEIKLRSFPIWQWITANAFLTPNYYLSRVKIVIENPENIPKGESVIFAMNHTDRYNYWPFQYKIWRMGGYRHTTIWTKGKYFHNPVVGGILKSFGAIPLLSKGYLVEEFFKRLFDRKISLDEYRVIRDLMEKKIQLSEAFQRSSLEVKTLLSDSWHNLYSSGKWQRIAGMRDSFIQYVEDHYSVMMEKIAEMTRSALFEKGLSLIVFPEGTRMTTLGEGKTGIAQLAMHTGKTVIPVGCNNSESVYPGNSPVARRGTVIYRVGKPLTMDGDFSSFRIDGSFRLFSRESQSRFGEQFEGVTRMIMDRIQSLLDERYIKPEPGRE